MWDHAQPVLVAAFAWWIATGAILWLDQRPARTYPFSLAVASLALIAAVAGLAAAARDTGPLGAYAAFLCALVVWGWLEMAFLMGFITGPNTKACPPEARGWRRFRLAAGALIYHEIAIALAALGVIGLSWGHPNQTGPAAFLILMIMRLSTKFNIFLGVANMAEQFLPPHLDYLKSYFRRAPFNPLFPLSIGLGLGLAFMVGAAALAAPDGSGAAIGASLVFALIALAVIEHVMLMTPAPEFGLWRWARASAASSLSPSHMDAAPPTSPLTPSPRASAARGAE
jgi:putative photosynthetic complex assembly protein 2